MEVNYKEIVESHNDIIYELNSRSRFSYGNAMLLELSGYSLPELLELHYWEIVAEDWRDRVVRYYKVQREMGLRHSYLEFPMVGKHGKQIWLGQKVQVLRDDDERVYGVRGMARDITDRVKLQEDLAQKEKMIFEVQGIAEIGTWEFDLRTGDIQWSELTRRIHDAADDYVPDFETAVDFYDAESKIIVQQGLEKSMATGESSDLKVRIISAKGVKKWVRTIMHPVRENGNTVKFYGLFQDISIQKEYEQFLLDENRDLTRLKDDTISAARAQEEFLSTVSHELRTPLNVVVNMVQILQNEQPRQDQLAYLEALEYSSKNLLDLINDILDLSKIQHNELQLQPKPVDLKRLLGAIKNSLQASADKKAIGFNLSLDAEIPDFIVADGKRLNQVLLNLAGNAIKFTEKGEVSIALKRLDADATNVQIYFEVADTGIGIPLDKHKRIFHRFKQSADDVHEYFGGTGLGLSISDGLVTLMNGTIALQSQPGKGSVFSFSLSLPVSDKKRVAGAVPQSGSNALSREILRGIKIVLADDNHLNLLVIEKLMEFWGAEIITVKNGLEAVEAFKAEHPDMVILDIQMPIMNGFEAGRTIRDLDPDIPIVALTAGNISQIRAKTDASGINAVLPKPIDQSALLREIGKQLKRDFLAERNTEKPLLKNGAQAPTHCSFNKIKEMADGDPAFYLKLLQSADFEITRFLEMADAEIYDSSGRMKPAAHRLKPTLEILNLNEILNAFNGVDIPGENNSEKSRMNLYIRLSEMIRSLRSEILIIE